jgi:hypothetical protein
MSEENKTEHRKKRAMLAALARTGVVVEACRAAKVGRTSHYAWLKEDPQYAAAVEDAMEQAADLLEAEARLRATEGVEEPIIGRVGKDQDGVITTVRKKSDTLLIFLLKGRRPEVFRERAEVRHTGGVNVSGIDLSKLSAAELAQVEALLSKAAEGGDAPAQS